MSSWFPWEVLSQQQIVKTKREKAVCNWHTIHKVKIPAWQLSPLSLFRHLKDSPSSIPLWDEESALCGKGRRILGCVHVTLSIWFSSQGKTLWFQTVSVHASWQDFLVKSEKCMKTVKHPTQTRSFLPVQQPQLFLHTLSAPDL